MTRLIAPLAALTIVAAVVGACSSVKPLSDYEKTASVSQGVTLVNVATQGGGNARLNSVPDPTLTPAAVGGGAFGLRWRRQVRGSVYAQPLVVAGVDVQPSLVHPNLHNLLLVATMHNMVYAFDTDDASPDAPPIWKTNLRFPGNGRTRRPIRPAPRLLSALRRHGHRRWRG